MQRVLLINPPFVQLNTPYPATPYLKGYLNTIGVIACQVDLGLEVILKLFCREGLQLLFKTATTANAELSDNARRILFMQHEYLNTIDAVIRFLQNGNPTLAHRICSRNYLPEASRFAQTDDLDWAFGAMGTHDKARHLATLYLEDISDFIIETVDPHFGFSRYAEKIAASASIFDHLEEKLQSPDSFTDKILLELLAEKVQSFQPSVVGLSVPFPGNLYSALKCGQWLKRNHPEINVVMGGGYPNTELRSMTDTRVFQYVDFITIDDGEAPLQCLVEHLDGLRERDALKRIFVKNNNRVVFYDGSTSPDVPKTKAGTPDYSDLPLTKYLSVIETPNPMHRLWSDGRWNKLTLAHGCYWGRCTFCDTSLDYIKRFEPGTAAFLCDQMEQIIAQTGETGFHFVDEAAPPALLRSLAIEILRRGLQVSWWTNIRFEKNFTADLCYLLRESGCIAVSGGLEVASDRLLGLINKGVTVEQVTRVAGNFTAAGIMVHAYLMYGFPTQTAQETIDSLEVVRQLFEVGVVQSGFWHHFAMTAHSPVGLNPDAFQVKSGTTKAGSFANNELECIDKKGADHALFGEGLRKSLFNYMHGVCFDFPLQKWFDFKVPRTTIAADYIQAILENTTFVIPSPSSRLHWIGALPTLVLKEKKKKGKLFAIAELSFQTKKETLAFIFDEQEGIWLAQFLPKAMANEAKSVSYADAENDFQMHCGSDFVLFWNSKNMQKLRAQGLLMF